MRICFNNANYLEMAELGTPENPEIIDVSLPPRRPPLASRWRSAKQIVVWLIAVSVPALILDLLCFSLIQTALNYGGILPWLALMLLALPALIFSLIAIVGTAILLPALILTLLGRATTLSFNDPRFARFSRLRPR